MLIGASIRQFALLKTFAIGNCFLESEEQGQQGLRRLTGIIGRNNSGKSSLFEALDFAADCLRFSVPYAANLHERGGFAQLKTKGSQGPMNLRLYYAGPGGEALLCYDLQLEADSYGRPYVAGEAVYAREVKSGETRRIFWLQEGRGEWCPEGGQEAEAIALGDLKQPALAIYGKILRYRELRFLYEAITGIFYLRLPKEPNHQRLKQQAGQGGHRHLNSHADNVKNVLRYLKTEDPRAYKHMLQRLEAQIPQRGHIDDRILDRGVESSETKLFSMLLLLEDPKPRPLLLLENPDEGLHHEMVDALGKALRRYSLRRETVQVLVSTHSQVLLEHLGPEEVWVLRRASEATWDPQARRLPEEDAEDLDERALLFPRQPDTRGTEAWCIASSETVRAMYREGVGLGALWYAGYFDPDPAPDLELGQADGAMEAARGAAAAGSSRGVESEEEEG